MFEYILKVYFMYFYNIIENISFALFIFITLKISSKYETKINYNEQHYNIAPYVYS